MELHQFIWAENSLINSFLPIGPVDSLQILHIFLSNEKQNITDAAWDLMVSSVLHIFLFVTVLFININFSLPISHTSLLPTVWATLVALAQRSGWMPLHCYVEQVWPAHWGDQDKYIINNKPIFCLGFAFFSFSVYISNSHLPCWFILALCYPHVFHGKLNLFFTILFGFYPIPILFLSAGVCFSWISLSEHGWFCSDPCKDSCIFFPSSP